MTIKISLQRTSKFCLIDEADSKTVSKFKWYLFKTDKLEYATTSCKFIDGEYIPNGLISHSEIAKARRENTHQLFEKGAFYPEGSLTRLFMHRLIMKAKKGQIIDHKNGHGLDNRKINLRINTHAENMRNSKLQKNNTSGYKGVSYSADMKRRKRWMAQIRIGDGKRVHLGRFYTKDEAAIAYNRAAKKYHGEFARLNEIYPPLTQPLQVA